MNIKKECERRGWRLLNKEPVLNTESEEAFYRHGEETTRIIAEFEQQAAVKHGLWAVTRSYIDPAHEGKKIRCRFIEPYGLQDYLEVADLKNGVDAAISNDGALILIANGQGYIKDGMTYEIITEVFECHLLNAEDAKKIQKLT